jgi:hypothetical protein
MATYENRYRNEKNEHRTPETGQCAARLRAPAGAAGQKKARYGSGLNLSLEENRGDRHIMLQRKIEIQFIFPITVIGFANSTTRQRFSRARLVHGRKCSTIAKCLKNLYCR